MVKKLLKEIPFLSFLRAKAGGFIRIWRNRHFLVTARELNLMFVQFGPGSAGLQEDKAAITINSAQQTFPLICELLELFSHRSVEIKRFESLCTDDLSIAAASQLSMLFNKYGSDKSSYHNHHFLYANILAGKRLDKLSILEIGIGTNNTDVVSNMGLGGQPGASLRAFREYLPNSRIYGADIDGRILFQEERIKTFLVDQTNKNSFDELSIALGNEKFDLIIDDGLHSPHANLTTLIFALSSLKPKGWLVVEDICNESLPIWKVISTVLPSSYSHFVVQDKAGLLFALQNN